MSKKILYITVLLLFNLVAFAGYERGIFRACEDTITPLKKDTTHLQPNGAPGGGGGGTPSCHLSGPFQGIAGITSTYTISCTPATNPYWVVSCGSIISGLGTNSITVQWPAGGCSSSTVEVQDVDFNILASTTVSAYAQLGSGVVSPSSQWTNYNWAPDTLSTTSPTGGDGAYSYQWQSSPTGAAGSWSYISGATSSSYTPGPLTSLTYFQLVVTDYGETVTSNVVSVNVYPPLVAGSVSPGTQNINYNSTPASLTGTAPTGGTGTYSYQWWYNPVGGPGWIPISGATGLTYAPGPQTVSTNFLFQQVSNGAIANTIATVNVYPQLIAGSVSPGSQNINYNSTPASLTGTAPTGGTGTYSYQWWYNPIGGPGWIPISGATGLTYALGPQTVSTNFLFQQVSNGAIANTIATVNVYPQLFAGMASPATQTINYNTAPTTLTATAPTGGNGVYSYQWLYLPSGGSTWISIPGANSLSYSPGQLTQTTTYLVQVVSNGAWTNSNTVTVNVYPQLNGGTASPGTQNINYNTTPSTLTATAATGGNGIYSYQWLYLPAGGSTWISIPGANSLSYSPGSLTQTTTYLVQVVSNGAWTNSNNVTVNVYPQLVSGTIGSAVGNSLAYGADPGDLTVTPASGGNGSYTYQWQSSTDNIHWTTVGSGSNYDPGALYNNTYYQFIVTSNGVTVSSNTLPLTVSAPVNAPGSDVLPGGTAPLTNMPSDGTNLDPDNMNYIRTRSISKPGIFDTGTADGLTNAYDVHQATTYFDGLGRSIQAVDKQATPSQGDMISTTFYDPFGRVTQQYLPYTDNTGTGKFRTDAVTQQPVFYNGYFANTESYYYNNTVYEASPLNRVLQSTSPGNSWTGNNRGTTQQYLVNTAVDDVQIWTVTSGETDWPVTNASYAAGTLYVNKTIDENGHAVVEYKDLEGQVVLKKVQEAINPSPSYDGWLCTYYVYDDLNALRCVIPPKATAQLSGNGWNLAPLTGLCFQYAYDGRKRMILKKVPDAAPVYLVYNLKDLPVLSQDGNLRSQNQWLVTQYDALNRPVQTGIYTAGTTYSLDAMQAQVDANQAYPTSGITVNTMTYYDDYSQVSVPSYTGMDVTKLLPYSNSYPDPVVQSSQTMGLPTTVQTRVLQAGATQWLTTVQYYDEKGRVIQTIADNISGSRDTTTTLYDFSGKVLSTYDRHNNAASRLNPRTTVLHATTYDHMGRVISTTEQLNDNAVNKTISTLNYDALGQLSQKNLGNNIESLAYDYNIRGWLRGVNRNYITGSGTHFFGMELNYDYGYGISQYNGNIAGMKWKSAGDGIPRAYGYGYDPVNRLQFADFKQDNSGAGTNFTDDSKLDFDVPQISYDPNGNILSMKQNGFKIGGSAPIDQLSYAYSNGSNQLLSVTDLVPADTSSRLGDFQDGNTSGNDYSYDPNGNLKLDANKHIDSIRYNYLNLPEYIHINGKGTINYVYDAGGTKYQKIVMDSTKGGAKDTTTYIGAFVYHSDTLQFLGHEEGRIRYVNKINQVSGQPFSGLVYDYFLKDHLGNTRMVLTEEQDTSIYMATEEQNKAIIEDQLFNNVNTTQFGTPSGFEPSSGADTSNHFVSRLNGNTSVSGNQRVGPSIVLKVMSGDTLSANVYGWYQGAVQSPPPGETPLINDLLTTLSNDVVGASGGHLIGSLNPVNNALGAVLPNFLSGVKDADDNSSQPKAFLNWVLFDNQLNYVIGGVTQVPAITGTMSKQVMQASMPVMPKNGYLYVYVSNESQQDVFFDNLNIQYRRGPLLEEIHYYPFGLTMAGISDKALKANYAENKYRFNKGSELQNKEFSDGSGLEMYETQLRELDPQLGRWWQIDSKPNEAESPYASMGNNPIFRNDPLGDEDQACCKGVWDAVKNLGIGLYNTAGYDARIINTYVNPATPFVEAAIGKSVESDFSENKSRAVSATEAAITLIPLGKVANTVVKVGENLLLKEGEKVAENVATKAAESSLSRKGALNEIKRDLGIPKSQHPDQLAGGRQFESVPMTDRNGKQILNGEGKPLMSREYTYTKPDGTKVIVQDHSAGHPQFGENNPGSHFNVRPPENTRTGDVIGALDHYIFNNR
jgi:RHS repeat-associated protein